MKAVFIRATGELRDKSGAIREAIAHPGRNMGQSRFDVTPKKFGGIPRSPFVYTVSDRVRALFSELPKFESEGRTAKQGLATADDFRFARMWTEVAGRNISKRWFPLLKGGKSFPFYADIFLVVDWSENGELLKSFSGSVIRNPEFYFHAGLTWPARPNKRGTFTLVPRGCVFSHTGTMVFEQEESFLLSTCAILNSAAYIGLLHLLMPRGLGETAATLKYEVGYITSVPVPKPSKDFVTIFNVNGRKMWSFSREFDTISEISHVFTIPGALVSTGDYLAERVNKWTERKEKIEKEIASLQAEIDDICFNLYGIDGVDRAQIEHGLGGNATDSAASSEEIKELDATPLVSSLLSWCVGVAFGRFDLRLATGEREAPPEPDPFDPLPICSPGMLTGEYGLPLDDPPPDYAINFPLDGILVDDLGADRDLVARSRQVFEHIFDDPSARWEEAAGILGDRDQVLRSWFARQFFGLHIKQYSKSRRKAPIYWQLATSSASYSTWLYYHRFTQDTLFRLLNDHITPKLQHEERKLTNLIQEVGPNPTTSQGKEIDTQETFVGELRGLRDEITRVAPLWNPNLNDGVILNFAPLWRLVPQHKAWQKECKSAWNKLCKGDYDWAHLAMHLWPERVVPKCAEDRSLAIAHELEEAFWYEDDDGKWQQKSVSQKEIENLIAARTSPAVKDAVKTLQEAPSPNLTGPQKIKKSRTQKRTTASKSAKQKAKTMDMFSQGDTS